MPLQLDTLEAMYRRMRREVCFNRITPEDLRRMNEQQLIPEEPKMPRIGMDVTNEMYNGISRRENTRIVGRSLGNGNVTLFGDSLANEFIAPEIKGGGTAKFDAKPVTFSINVAKDSFKALTQTINEYKAETYFPYLAVGLLVILAIVTAVTIGAF